MTLKILCERKTRAASINTETGWCSELQDPSASLTVMTEIHEIVAHFYSQHTHLDHSHPLMCIRTSVTSIFRLYMLQ